MFPFQYVRDLVVFLRGLPGASGYGSTTTAEQVTEGLDLQAYTAIVTGKVQQNRKDFKKLMFSCSGSPCRSLFCCSCSCFVSVFDFLGSLFLFLFFGDGILCWRLCYSRERF